jgi:hypothetical protein
MLVALVGLSLAPPRARKSKAAMAYAEQVGPEAFYLFGTGLGDGLPELQATHGWRHSGLVPKPCSSRKSKSSTGWSLPARS